MRTYLTSQPATHGGPCGAVPEVHGRRARPGRGRPRRGPAGMGALLALAVASVGLAPTASAQTPGQNGSITYTAEVQYEVPCFGSVMDDPPGPLSVEAVGMHAWSPDGLSVAAEVEDGVLVVRPADCSWHLLPVLSRLGISWSPDGTRLAVVLDGDVAVVSAETGAVQTRVTTGAAVRQAISWSPTGDVVAYGAADGVRVAPVDGSAPTGTLLIPGGAHPDFSPDGERIAYVERDQPSSPSRLAHVRAVDGGDVVRLPAELMPEHLAWSPDGRSLVFAGSVDTGEGPVGPDCYVTDLTGTTVTALEVVPAPCSRPAWQPKPVDPDPVADLTLVYLYPRIDPTRRPSWGNSGPQTLVDVLPGHQWLPRTGALTLEDLPAGVCGPGWAVQTDRTTGLRRSEVPTTIDRATGTNVLGWGRALLTARHHSLEYYLDVPPCEAADGE